MATCMKHVGASFLIISFIFCGGGRPKVFRRKGVLRNFAKFTGKHLCHNLFFNKIAGLRPRKKRDPGTGVFQ